MRVDDDGVLDDAGLLGPPRRRFVQRRRRELAIRASGRRAAAPRCGGVRTSPTEKVGFELDIRDAIGFDLVLKRKHWTARMMVGNRVEIKFTTQGGHECFL